MPSTPEQLIVVDGHVDVRPVDGGYAFPVEDARAGGVHAAVVPVKAGLLPRAAGAAAGQAELAATFEAIHRLVAESDGTVELVRSPGQVRRNAERGVFSIILGLQNGRPLADLAALEHWLDRGVAIVDLGFIGDNQWVTSSRPYPYASLPTEADGISHQALDALALLNERGIVVDTAQVSVRARERIIEASTAPVIASHNGLRAQVGQADRTLTDDEVRAVAGTGGLVQVVAFDGYLTPRGDDPVVVADIRELRERFGLPGHRGPADYYALLDEETADWDEQTFSDYFAEYHAKVRNGWPKSDVERLIDSVDHVIGLVGVDHVGIASDFHHGGGITGWLEPSQTANVTAALRRRHSEDDVQRIWGGNLLRVWDEVLGD